MGSLNKLMKRKKGGVLVPRMRKYMFQHDLDLFHGSESAEEFTIKVAEYGVAHYEKVLAQYSARKGRVRGIGKFHPSQMGGCERAIWFGVFGATGNPPVSAEDSLKTHLIFSMGDSVHLRHQTLFHLMGVLEAAEIPVVSEKDGVEGHCDGIVCIDGERYVLEIKSCNSGSYAYTQEPKEQHIRQIRMYMKYLGIRKGIILYENKDRHDLKEFIVHQDDAEIAKIVKSITEIRKCVIERKPPPRLGKSPSDRVCAYCGFTGECFNELKMKAFIKTLKGVSSENTGTTKKATARPGIKHASKGNSQRKQVGTGSALRSFVKRA